MDIQKIREKQGLDAVLLFASEEILAASEVYAQKSCLIVEEGAIALVCPEGEEGAAGIQCLSYAEVGFEHVERARENFWQRIQGRLKGKHRVGVNLYSCPMAFLKYGPVDVEYRDISEEILEAMLCKGPSFFEKYAEVGNLNRMAYDRIRENIHAGCTEQELAEQVREAYVRSGEAQVLYTGDFLSGERTLKIAGPATNRVIGAGDTLIVDALCAKEGVFCDTTRSFFCESPTREQEKVYYLLTTVLGEAAKLLRPGTIAGDVYRYIDRRFQEEGYGGLVHHAGHGLGYKWYEAPYFIEKCRTVLQENMLVALEPGIYVPKMFGLRIENNYRVTRDGGVDVFDYKWKLEDFIIE